MVSGGAALTTIGIPDTVSFSISPTSSTSSTFDSRRMKLVSQEADRTKAAWDELYRHNNRSPTGVRRDTVEEANNNTIDNLQRVGNRRRRYDSPPTTPQASGGGGGARQNLYIGGMDLRKNVFPNLGSPRSQRRASLPLSSEMVAALVSPCQQQPRGEESGENNTKPISKNDLWKREVTSIHSIESWKHEITWIRNDIQCNRKSSSDSTTKDLPIATTSAHSLPDSRGSLESSPLPKSVAIQKKEGGKTLNRLREISKLMGGASAAPSKSTAETAEEEEETTSASAASPTWLKQVCALKSGPQVAPAARRRVKKASSTVSAASSSKRGRAAIPSSVHLVGDDDESAASQHTSSEFGEETYHSHEDEDESSHYGSVAGMAKVGMEHLHLEQPEDEHSCYTEETVTTFGDDLDDSPNRDSHKGTVAALGAMDDASSVAQSEYASVTTYGDEFDHSPTRDAQQDGMVSLGELDNSSSAPSIPSTNAAAPCTINRHEGAETDDDDDDVDVSLECSTFFGSCVSKEHEAAAAADLLDDHSEGSGFSLEAYSVACESEVSLSQFGDDEDDRYFEVSYHSTTVCE